MYNYDDNGALSITHFAPDTVTTACGAYILDGRAAWTAEPGLVEGCPPCIQAAQNGDQNGDQTADQVDNGPPSCHCPDTVGGCPCYNLGYARAKQEMADSQPATGAAAEA